MKQLTKTDFILYRECPNNVWTKWHMPEEYKKFPVSEFEQSLGEMGEDVEIEARKLFPGGYLIGKRSEGAQKLTKKLISEHTPVIFQAVFATDKYLAATDVLKWDQEAKAYDLYEIKMSSAENEDEEKDDGKPPKINRKKESNCKKICCFCPRWRKACFKGIFFDKAIFAQSKNTTRAEAG